MRVLAAEPPAGELVQGLRSLDEGYTPPIFDPDVLDGKIVVRPGPSVEWARRIVRETGISAGSRAAPRCSPPSATPSAPTKARSSCSSLTAAGSTSTDVYVEDGKGLDDVLSGRVSIW